MAPPVVELAQGAWGSKQRNDDATARKVGAIYWRAVRGPSKAFSFLLKARTTF